MGNAYSANFHWTTNFSGSSVLALDWIFPALSLTLTHTLGDYPFLIDILFRSCYLVYTCSRTKTWQKENKYTTNCVHFLSKCAYTHTHSVTHIFKKACLHASNPISHFTFHIQLIYPAFHAN